MFIRIQFFYPLLKRYESKTSRGWYLTVLFENSITGSIFCPCLRNTKLESIGAPMSGAKLMALTK